MPAIIGLALAAGLALQPAARVEDERVVRVYATALDERGGRVDDLGVDEFTVTEDGVERAIEGATFVTTVGPAVAPEGFPGAIRSRVDEQVEAARDGARLFAFLLDEYHVAPGQAAADVRGALGRFVRERLGPRDLLVVFKPLDSLLNIRLTRDRDAALDAIGSFLGRKGVYEPRNAFERDFLASEPGPNDRGRVQISTAALNALVAHLGGLEAGPKALVVVSEGIGGVEWRARVEATARTAHRGGVAVYAIDPRADGDDDEPFRRLALLAEATDGRAIRGADRVDAGLRQMADDLGGYYVLTFRSRATSDGAFPPVRVSTDRPGVAIRSSRGHWTGSLTEEGYGTVVARAAAVPLSPPMRRTSALIRPWFGVVHTSDGRSRVSFVWEPAQPTPGTRGASRKPARVVLRVSVEDGVTIFDGVVTPTGPGSRESSRAIFVAPPGRLRVDMRIEDDRAEYLDFDVRDLTVGLPDRALALGTAQVFRTRNAREFRAVAGDADAVPVASREFSRAERLVVRVPVLSREAGDLVVTAALTTTFGRVMRALTARTGPSADVRQIDVPLAGLVAGEYRLDITAAGAGGAAREVVPFRVVP